MKKEKIIVKRTVEMLINDNSSNIIVSGANASNITITKKASQCTINHSPATPKIKSNNDTCRALHNVLLDFLDIVISCIIIAPCVVAYWRGTWELMNVYIFPKNVLISALVSFAIGGLGHMLFTLTQYLFAKHIHPDQRRLTFYIVSRLYTALFGFVCVNMWRGSWILCDCLTSANSLIIISIVTVMSLIFMVATRTIRNLASPPYTVCIDDKCDYFDVTTMFNIDGLRQPGLYFLDTLFSVFVCGSLIVLVWRGSWGILDLILFPNNRTMSAWGSLIMGYAIVLLTLILLPIFRCISNQTTDGISKLIICDIYHILSFFGAVNCWRGIWMLIDIYLFAGNKLLGYWVTTIIPFLILLALKCSNSVLVRGIDIDAGGRKEDLDLQIGFCKTHFEQQRIKKYAKHAQNLQQYHLSRNMDQESHSMLIEKPQKSIGHVKIATKIENV